MRFKDREEAGKKLIERLATYKDAKDAVVVALPRGGVVLGRVVADALGLPLDIVVARKIGAPGKCPGRYGSLYVTHLSARAERLGSSSMTRSMRTNGARCGRIRRILVMSKFKLEEG